MIRANQLRIGNFLYVSGNTIDTYQTSKPKRVDIDFLKAIDEENKQRPDGLLTWFNPIPLTPEILEKCGFNVTSKGFYQHPNWYNLSLKYFRGSYALRCNFMDIITNNIYYVHQLQNLYHALTGEELEINEFDNFTTY